MSLKSDQETDRLNDNNVTKTDGKNKKNKKPKKKSFPTRVNTGAIEQKEIASLQTRYPLIDVCNIQGFNDIPLSKKTLKGLKDSDYTTPTEIQRESIVLALKGLDILGAAKTGSGKTLAFVIPVLERLYCMQWTRLDGLGALIITPTRELAYQIFETFRKVGQHHEFSAGLIIGGKDLNFERKRLNQCNIMICTPGRLLHHMDENPLFDCSRMQILVIDEADRCLDMGFEQTMNGIIENLPLERQTLLFSATQTKSVKDLARLSLKDPVYVSVHEHAKFSTPESLRQSYIVAPVQNKMDILWSFLKSHRKKKLIVFMTCCKQVRFIHQSFSRLRPGISVMALYGTMHQLKRMAVYEEFCRKQTAVLLATDIAARGLDFPAVDWVLQLDCPEDANSYIHRAGRTARYQKGGESLLVLLPSEEEGMIDQLKQKKIPIQKIEVNPRKMMSIQRKLEAMLAKDVELKQMAQRAFVTYIKSVFLMKDKNIFDVKALDFNALSRSLGLAVAPRVRFLQRREKLEKTSNKEEPETNTWRKEEFQDSYQFHLNEQDSASEEEILTLKRKDHALNVDEGDMDDVVDKRKKHKILTKEKVAKRILRKKLQANQKVTFDEEGNRIYDPTREKVSEVARALELTTDTSHIGGIDLEQARAALIEEDKFDKQLFRQKIKARHREERLKTKLQRRQADTTEGDSTLDDDEEETEVNDIIDALPDPDKIYGQKDDESDEASHYSGSPVQRKRLVPSSSDSDNGSESEEEITVKKPWKKPKPQKKKAKFNSKADFNTGLDLALDEELALHLLGSTS